MSIPQRRTRPLVTYVVTEDWFFASHFLPMARAAQDAGFDVSVMARVGAHRELLEAEGVRVLPLDADRRSFAPLRLLGAVRRMTRTLRAERPDIVHLIALRSIVLGGVAARAARIERRVVALTGTGLLGLSGAIRARLARAILRRTLRRVLDGPRCRFLFENRDDPALLGLPADSAKAVYVGGAGVDPERYTPAPMPPGPSLEVALVARMVWSKGVDLAVEAVKLARAQGADVRLTLFGVPDLSNPASFSAAQLRAWGAEEGVTWQGFTNDVGAVWATRHLCCLPSRGGEGLPRSLLEAAACGRAILTTDVPGCRDFVRDGVDGLVVPPEDARALAHAIVLLSRTRERLAAMGVSSRRRVVDGYTEAAVGDAVATLYRTLIDG